MERLTETVHQILAAHLRAGDIAIDATAGNGHDTLFLARAVGPTGRVYAFDLQTEALEQTRRRLEAANLANAELLQQSHADLQEHIPRQFHGQIAAVTFNLGYLPGADKSFVTQAGSTRTAIRSALGLLRDGGVLTVVAYTGHPGGLAETEAVQEVLQALPETEFTVESHIPDREQAPRLFVAIRREKSGKTATFPPDLA